MAYLSSAIVALLSVCAGPVMGEEARVSISIKLPDVDSVELVRDINGTLRYVVLFDDGRQESLAPDAFSMLVSERLSRRSWLERFCNISSPVGFLWVLLGLTGQVLFTGRLLVQWFASEREKRSVVPVAFWWMSLIGGALLLAYFTWRRDIIGFLGQMTGFTIYTRNLILIYGRRRDRYQLRQPTPARVER